jgi:hypothetical protein
MPKYKVLERIYTLYGISICVISWEKPSVMLFQQYTSSTGVPDIDPIVRIVFAAEFRSIRANGWDL